MESGVNNCAGNESLPEVVDGEEMVNEEVVELEESEPSDDEIEIDFEAYGHMNESVLNEPDFQYVFKNEPKVVSPVQPATPIAIDSLEKYVVCVSANGLFTFEKIKKETDKQPGENNTEPSENEECAGHFDTETEEAEENTFEEEEISPLSKSIIHSKESAKEKSAKPIETSPNKSVKIVGRRARTSEGDKVRLSTKSLTHDKQGTKIISAKHVEHCSNEFDEKLTGRAVVVLEKCVLPSSSGTPAKVCETIRVTSGNQFSAKTNNEKQGNVARALEKESGLNISAVEGRNLRRIRKIADNQVAESSPCHDERRTVERRKTSNERTFFGALRLRQSVEQNSLESHKEVRREKQTPEKLELRNLRRITRNEMTKQSQQCSLSVRKLRQRRNLSTSRLSTNHSESDDENVECEEHLSPGKNKENPEKLRAGARNLRQSRRNEAAQQRDDSSSSDDDEKRIVSRLRKPRALPSSSGPAKNQCDNENNLSLLVQCKKLLLPETRKENQEKLRTEAQNLRRSRRKETVKQLEESSSSDGDGRNLARNKLFVAKRQRKSLSLFSLSGAHTKTDSETDDGDRHSFVVESEDYYSSETSRENQVKLTETPKKLELTDEGKSLSQICKQLEVRCLSNVETIIGWRRKNATERTRRNRAKETPEKCLQANEERRRKGSNEALQQPAERRAARRSSNKISKEIETPAERENYIADRLPSEKCVANETPEQFQVLNGDDKSLDDDDNDSNHCGMPIIANDGGIGDKSCALDDADEKSATLKCNEKETREQHEKPVADKHLLSEKCVANETSEQFGPLNRGGKSLENGNSLSRCDALVIANEDGLDDENCSIDDADLKMLARIRQREAEEQRRRRARETPEQREKRLKTKAARKRWRIANESPEERELRLAAKRLSRKKSKEKKMLEKSKAGNDKSCDIPVITEPVIAIPVVAKPVVAKPLTAEEKKLARFRAKESERKKRSRANETPEQRAKRLKATMERNRRLRANETPEQREKRLKATIERNKRLKANETPDQRERRRKANRLWYKRHYEKKRAPEKSTSSKDNDSNGCSRDDAYWERLVQKRAREADLKRLAQIKSHYADKYRRRKANETPEQREKRNKAKAERRKMRRANETPEERELRLAPRRVSRNRGQEKEMPEESEESVADNDDSSNSSDVLVIAEEDSSADERYSPKDEEKIAKISANLVQISSEVVTASNEDENSLSLAVACEEHFSPKETLAEHENPIADRYLSQEKCVANETPELIELLNVGDKSIDDGNDSNHCEVLCDKHGYLGTECCSLEDEEKIAEKSAEPVQTEPCASPASSGVLATIDDEEDNEGESSLPLAAACEQHLTSKIREENPENLTKIPEEYEISLRNLKQFRTVNGTSKLKERHSAVNGEKMAQTMLPLNHKNYCKVDDRNSISLEVEYEKHFSAPKSDQEKLLTVNEMFELSLSDDARRECSSDDEYHPCNAENYSSDDEYYTSDEEQVKRRRRTRALPSVAETPTKALNEHSYSLEKRVVHFELPVTESVKQKEVPETLELFEERCQSVGEEIIAETRTSPPTLPSVSESPTKSYCRIDEEHCYTLDKCKIYKTPELTEIEKPQMTTRTIERGANRALADAARRARMKRAEETPEQLAKRLARLDADRERYRMRLATETPEEREKRRAIKRAAWRRRREKETLDQRDERLAKRSMNFKKILENETLEERAKRHYQRSLFVQRNNIKKRVKFLENDLTNWERHFAMETMEQREKRCLLDNQRQRIKRATETAEERRAYYRERFKEYTNKSREDRMEIIRAQRANETPELREKRLEIVEASKQKARERRANFRANNVKKAERIARERASKRIVNNGKRRREELAARNEIISKILQRRAVVVLKHCDSPSFEEYEENFLASRRKNQAPEKCRVRANGRNLRPISSIKTIKRLVECDSSDDEDEIRSTRRTAEAVEKMRRKISNETPAEREKRFRANAERNRKRVANEQRIKRLKFDVERMRKQQIVNETPEELEKRLAAETLTFRNLIQKYCPFKEKESRNEEVDETTKGGEKHLAVEDSVVSIDEKLEKQGEVEGSLSSGNNNPTSLAQERVTQAEECEKHLAAKDLVVNIDEKLETREELEEILAFIESSNNNPTILAQKDVTQAEECEKSLPTKDLVIRVDDKLETPEELEARLEVEKLAFRESISKYSTYFAPDGVMREECESGLADKNVVVRLVKESETPEEMEARRATDRMAFRELMGKYPPNKQRKWITFETPEERVLRNEETPEEHETRIAAETLAFRKWREVNPLTELQFYVFKYLANKNGIVIGARTWRESEKSEIKQKNVGSGKRRAAMAEKRRAAAIAEKRRAAMAERRRVARAERFQRRNETSAQCASAEPQPSRTANEMPDECEERLAAISKSRAEQREKRRVAQRQRRENARAEQLEKHRKTRAEKLVNETPEQREKRLNYRKAYNKRRREVEILSKQGRRKETEAELTWRLSALEELHAVVVERQPIAIETPEERLEKEMALERARKEKKRQSNRRRKVEEKLKRQNETQEEREKRLVANRQRKRQKKERETPEQRDRRRELDKLYTRRRRAAKKAAALQQNQQEQGKCNEPMQLDSNDLDATTEEATLAICSISHDTNDKVVVETLDSNCSKSFDLTDEDGKLSICLNSCDTNNEVGTETPCINNNNYPKSFAAAVSAAISDDHIYSNGGDTTNDAETLTDSNSGDVVNQFQALVNSNGLVINGVDALSNAQTFSIVANEDGAETLVNLSSNIAVNGDVIYALSNDDEQASGTAPTTFYVTNEDGTSSEIVVVYIDGVAT